MARNLVHLLLLTLLSGLASSLLPGELQAAGKRPNIVFAFADDWGRNASIYAKVDGPGTVNEAIRTPNVDRIAREGVLFKNAFVTAPSCTPCRSSLLSGQYFFRTGRGAILQGAVWDPDIPTYPLLLQEAGYHIGQTWKVWVPGTPADAPYGGHATGYEKAGGSFNAFSQSVTRMMKQGKSMKEAKEVLYQQVRGNFDAFLAKRKSKDQPFCYWFGPTNVHRKWIRGSGKKLWGVDPDTLKGKLPPFLPDVPEVREDYADYLGEVMAFDAGLGVLLEKLAATGELENTLIVVSGDHGAAGFPHGKCDLYDFGTGVTLAARWGAGGGKAGRVVDDFVNLMDLAPTFLDAGGVSVPEVMTGRSLVEIINSQKDGLVNPKRTWVITGRERHVAKARKGMLPYPMRALRTQEYLYIHNFKPDRWPMGDPFNLGEGEPPPSAQALTERTFVTFMDFDASPTKAWLVARRKDPKWKQHYDWAFGKRPREELYLLANDPHQVKNVAGDPAHADLRDRLRQRLMGELTRLGDPRVTGDGSTFDKPPYAGK